MKKSIGFKGDRDLWVRFVNQLRIEKEEVWEVLEPMILDYMKDK